MYEAFYQLSADPFRLSPDPGFSFQHRTYRKAMTYMLHALHRAEGYIMITGQPGTGKTTLVNDLIATLKPNQAVVAKIVSTKLTADELLNLVAYSFNLDIDGFGKAKVLVEVERFLKQQYQHGRRPLLVVDEAQDMGNDALEELRLLTNILVGNHQLLQVFLVGQEQLRDMVNTPALEQLNQRLIAATLLEPLDSDNTGAYIKHRLRRVNWRGDPLISKEAYAMIQWYSHGIPRRINQICSRLFLYGCIGEKHRLGLADVEVVVEELQQELLLPMEMEAINGMIPSSAEQNEETYEKEPQLSSPAAKTVRPSPKPLPVIERVEQKSSAAVASAPLHMPARVPVASPGPGADNNEAAIHQEKHGWQLKLLALFTVLDSHASKAARLLRDRMRKVSIPEVWRKAVTVLPDMKTMLRTGRAEQKQSTEVTDTALHMPAKSPVSAIGPGTGNNQAGVRHEKPGWQLKFLALFAALDRYASKAGNLLRDRIGKTSIPLEWSTAVAALVLITTMLAAYFSDGDSDQPVRELETLAMSQIATQQLVESATEDREPEAVQPQPDTPATEAPANSGTRNSMSEAVGKTWGREKIFAATATENHQPPAFELATMETSLPLSPVAIGGMGKTPTLETANELNAEQSKLGEDEPVPAREDDPVISPSQGNQANKAADPPPAKKVNAPAPLSKEEKVAGLLEHGWRSLKQDRLLVPKNNNAYHYFQRVLKLDPGNSDARSGIEQVVTSYTRLATDALNKYDKKKAEQYIARGLSISPNNESLRALRDRMNAPSVKVASEQPPPIVIRFPEPEPAGFLTRVKTFFARQSTGKFGDRNQTDEP